MTDILFNGIVLGLLFGGMALGLGVLTGVVKFVNFAQADFLTLGMYSAVVLGTFSIRPYVSVLIGLPLSVVFGLLTYWGVARLVIRKNPTAQLIATLGMGLVMENVLLIIFSATSRRVFDPAFESSVNLAGASLPSGRLWAAGLAIVLALGTWLLMTRTDIGRLIRAVADDARAAECMGINIQRPYVVAWILALAIELLLGVPLVTFYPATPLTGWDFIIPMFLVLVLGGLDNLWGIMISGVLVGVYISAFSVYLPVSLSSVGLFGAFVVVLLVRPNGLFGRASRLV